MRKILLSTIVLSVSLAGVVSAAGIWGTYKGNDIIRLTVGGDPVKVSDVPAINYNNRTMIPIYLLQQAGIKYTWDQQNKTVDIIPQPKVDENKIKEIPISWLQFYSSVSDFYKNLHDLGLYMEIHHRCVFSTMDYVISNQDSSGFFSISDDSYNSIEKIYNNMYDKSENISSWMEQNNLPSDISQILKKYKYALDDYSAALDNIRKYKNNKSNQTYFNNYQDDLKSAEGYVREAQSLSDAGYIKFETLISNYR